MHREKENSSVHGLLVLFRKELADHLRSTRFLLMTALLTLTSMASLYGALSNIRDQATENSEFIFLSLFTTSGNSLPSICTFLAFLGPLAGIVLGFDCVNRERSLGTLNRLTAQPIYRDTVINGKFMAGFAAIFLMVFSLGILVSAIGLLVIGIAPQTEEVLRILAFLLFTVFYIAFWLGLSILFSVIWRHAATAALAGISIWIFLSFFMSMIAGAVADIAYPTEGIEGLFNLKSNYSLELGLNRISPYYLFGEAASTILNPNIRSIGIVTNSQLSGAIAGYLPFGQSLLLVWPHLVCMAALTMVCFALSYICFMKQEIRA